MHLKRSRKSRKKNDCCRRLVIAKEIKRHLNDDKWKIWDSATVLHRRAEQKKRRLRIRLIPCWLNNKIKIRKFFKKTPSQDAKVINDKRKTFVNESKDNAVIWMTTSITLHSHARFGVRDLKIHSLRSLKFAMNTKGSPGKEPRKRYFYRRANMARSGTVFRMKHCISFNKEIGESDTN